MKIPAQMFVQNDESFAWSIHKDRVVELGYSFQLTKSWASSGAFPETLEGGVFAQLNGSTKARVYQWDTACALLSTSEGSIYVDLCAHSEQAAVDWLAVIQEHLPEHESTPTDVPVSFWFDHPAGPRQMIRMIQVAPWDDVRGNYTADTEKGLDRLMRDFQPAVGGQLMLWQGVPGTGKTHALRALASEWRSWADLHYIVDPDNLFGRSAHYLIQVLLSDMDDGANRWRVLVLEDTGELLAADAKQQTGAGATQAVERRGRADRSGLADPGVGHDERRTEVAASGGRASGQVRGAGDVQAVHGDRGERLA